MSIIVRPALSRPAVLSLGHPLIINSVLHHSTPLRPGFITCSASSSRSFASSSRLRLEAGRTQHASTALQEEVKYREEERDIHVVGEEVKGAEGPHYQDKVIGDSLSSTDQNGMWTMMQPIYQPGDVDCVKVVGRKPITFADRLAHGLVKFMRGTFDLFARYHHYEVPPEVLAMKPIPVDQLRKERKILTVDQWMMRIILLESFAGCPGMVAGTLRHLRSLRLLRRDGGWIHTMLEEAENERMHLLTFLTIAQPSYLTRFLCLGAQGLMYNFLFLSYLVSPSTVHRFVGALEEEAVRTYTHCIDDLEKGLIPEWVDVAAPKIAIDYWRMPSSATLLDVIKAVRADESTHRFVNHSLANLDQKRDFNPFALGEPSARIRGTVPEFTRQECSDFARRTHHALQRSEAAR